MGCVSPLVRPGRCSRSVPRCREMRCLDTSWHCYGADPSPATTLLRAGRGPSRLTQRSSTGQGQEISRAGGPRTDTAEMINTQMVTTGEGEATTRATASRMGTQKEETTKPAAPTTRGCEGEETLTTSRRDGVVVVLAVPAAGGRPTGSTARVEATEGAVEHAQNAGSAIPTGGRGTLAEVRRKSARKSTTPEF